MSARRPGGHVLRRYRRLLRAVQGVVVGTVAMQAVALYQGNVAALVFGTSAGLLALFLVGAEKVDLDNEAGHRAR